jgi:hypothetical protein
LLRFGALLAEQATKLLDLIGELADLRGQRRQVWMWGWPLLVAGCFLGEQFHFAVPQRRGPSVVFGVVGGTPFAADLPNLLVEVSGVWLNAHPLLDGRQARFDCADAGRDVSSRSPFRLPGACARRLLAFVTVDWLDHLPDPVQVGTPCDQQLGGGACPSRIRPSRMCSVPMRSWPSCRASRSESSSTFFARGVKGMCPGGACCPRPMISSTCCRTACSDATKRAYTDGLLAVIDDITARLAPGDPPSARAKTLSVFALMTGTLQLSRALADRQLADEVLEQGLRTPSRCWAPGNSADAPITGL